MTILTTIFIEIMFAISQTTGRQCGSSYSRYNNHTACLNQSASLEQTEPLTQTEKKLIVEYHNEIRSNVIPTATNMLKLEWDEEVAFLAQRWADTCPTTEDSVRNIPGRYSDLGQNIKIHNGKRNFSDVLFQWNNTRQYFNYGSADFNNTTSIRYYLQLVWADTKLVGCGYSQCRNESNSTSYYVCNYAPGMNRTNISYPYHAGVTGEDCLQHKLGNLCNCGPCENESPRSLKDCKCVCKQKFYVESTCSLDCGIAQYLRNSTSIKECHGKSYADCTPELSHACPALCQICPVAYRYVDHHNISITDSPHVSPDITKDKEKTDKVQAILPMWAIAAIFVVAMLILVSLCALVIKRHRSHGQSDEAKTQMSQNEKSDQNRLTRADGSLQDLSKIGITPVDDKPILESFKEERMAEPFRDEPILNPKQENSDDKKFGNRGKICDDFDISQNLNLPLNASYAEMTTIEKTVYSKNIVNSTIAGGEVIGTIANISGEDQTFILVPPTPQVIDAISLMPKNNGDNFLRPPDYGSCFRDADKGIGNKSTVMPLQMNHLTGSDRYARDDHFSVLVNLHGGYEDCGKGTCPFCGKKGKVCKDTHKVNNHMKEKLQNSDPSVFKECGNKEQNIKNLQVEKQQSKECFDENKDDDYSDMGSVEYNLLEAVKNNPACEPCHGEYRKFKVYPDMQIETRKIIDYWPHGTKGNLEVANISRGVDNKPPDHHVVFAENNDRRFYRENEFPPPSQAHSIGCDVETCDNAHCIECVARPTEKYIVNSCSHLCQKTYKVLNNAVGSYNNEFFCGFDGRTQYRSTDKLDENFNPGEKFRQYHCEHAPLVFKQSKITDYRSSDKQQKPERHVKYAIPKDNVVATTTSVANSSECRFTKTPSHCFNARVKSSQISTGDRSSAERYFDSKVENCSPVHLNPIPAPHAQSTQAVDHYFSSTFLPRGQLLFKRNDNSLPAVRVGNSNVYYACSSKSRHYCTPNNLPFGSYLKEQIKIDEIETKTTVYQYPKADELSRAPFHYTGDSQGRLAGANREIDASLLHVPSHQLPLVPLEHRPPYHVHNDETLADVPSIYRNS